MLIKPISSGCCRYLLLKLKSILCWLAILPEIAKMVVSVIVEATGHLVDRELTENDDYMTLFVGNFQAGQIELASF